MASNGPQAASVAISGCRWMFAGREFDESRLELRVNEQPVDLELKPLEILIQLLHHAGDVVSKEQLLDAVWPGLEVVEGSLTTAVHKLRKALDDRDSDLIVTVPKVGYRLAVPVQMEAVRPSSSALSTDLKLKSGDPVSYREQWILDRSLNISPNSQVWLANHAKTREQRVFKFALSTACQKALRREVTVFRYLRESLGERPEFVRILEWNLNRQPCFVESEYGGPDLAAWAENRGGLKNVPLEKRIETVAAIAKAVAVAHSVGVLHKDLKQGNVLVAGGPEGKEQIKIVDFGSASLSEPSRLQALGITNLGFTQTGDMNTPAVIGTLMYLAPEVLSGHAPTAQADVYALGVILYQFVIADFRKPLSPGWEAEVSDALLREDIARAVQGDPTLRIASAAELAERLSGLDRRRREFQADGLKRKREQEAERKRLQTRARLPWIVTGVALVALAASVYFHKGLTPPVAATAPVVKSVAVLPFENVGPDKSVDFLRNSLPDEIATTLSYNRGLSVRAFRAASLQDQSQTDLQQTGHKMGVRTLVTGHFLKQGNQLQITLEAFDAETSNLFWRDTFVLTTENLIIMQQRVAATIREGLAPALGSSSFAPSAGSTAKSSAAYTLYLRSLAMLDDSPSNEEAINLLKSATDMDPDFAPAWSALALRYYNLWSFGGGGENAIRESEAAALHAQKLSPNSQLDGATLVRIWTEEGQLNKAYQEAIDLVQRRPDSGYAHFALSYVLRYAGLLKEADRQCEIARSSDPHDPAWRSCLSVYEQLGDFRRAAEFLRLSDPDSPYMKPHQIQQLVRQGKNKEALAIGPTTFPGWESYSLLQACAANRPAREIDSIAETIRPSRDSELNYAYAAHLSYCHKMADALNLLKLAIRGGHCSYPAIETDPLLANLRAMPEYPEILTEAKACQNNFLAERNQLPSLSVLKTR